MARRRMHLRNPCSHGGDVSRDDERRREDDDARSITTRPMLCLKTSRVQGIAMSKKVMLAAMLAAADGDDGHGDDDEEKG